jgi:hypothetical protein
MELRAHVQNLKSLYKENDYPSDRLFRHRAAITGFTNEFNQRLGTEFSAADISAELERIRKDKTRTGGLPKLGRRFGGPKFLDVSCDN